jgi:hypothetical protein
MSFVSTYFTSLNIQFKNILYGNNNFFYAIGFTDNKIYKIDMSGNYSTFATFTSNIGRIAFDHTRFPLGYLYVGQNDGVYRMSSTGVVTLYKSYGGFAFDGMVLDSSNNIYIGDGGNAFIRKIDSITLNVSTFNGADDVIQLQIDNSGNLYSVGNGQFMYNYKIYKFNSSGVRIDDNFFDPGSNYSLYINFDISNNYYVTVMNSVNSKFYINKYDSSKNLIGLIYQSTIANNEELGDTSFDSSGNLYFKEYNNPNTILYRYGETPSPPPCFKEGSKILTNTGYKPIQELRKGDLVKTLCDGFKAVDMIGFREIEHVASSERIKDQLYRCSNDSYSEVFEDLVITGCHSILVNEFSSKEQRQQTIQTLGKIYLTDNNYRLPACLDERATVYEIPGKYTIYHLALENENYYSNYGIFANGLLVESCSRRYLKELSNMTLID